MVATPRLGTRQASSLVVLINFYAKGRIGSTAIKHNLQLISKIGTPKE